MIAVEVRVTSAPHVICILKPVVLNGEPVCAANMKLFCGNIVSVGDKVAFTVRHDRATTLSCGIVKGFAKQMVNVEYYNKYSDSTITAPRMPHNMVKVHQD